MSRTQLRTTIVKKFVHRQLTKFLELSEYFNQIKLFREYGLI